MRSFIWRDKAVEGGLIREGVVLIRIAWVIVLEMMMGKLPGIIVFLSDIMQWVAYSFSSKIILRIQGGKKRLNPIVNR